MTPEQRRLRAQIAANTRWSRPMAREDQADAARKRRVRAAARAFSARLNSAKAKIRQRSISA